LKKNGIGFDRLLPSRRRCDAGAIISSAEQIRRAWEYIDIADRLDIDGWVETRK
jgi:hypothetical protein